MTEAMTARQRFRRHMTYQPVDRPPLMDFSFWPETIDAWHDQGLPHWVQRHYDLDSQERFFGMDPFPRHIGPNGFLCPAFEVKVLDDLGEEVIEQQRDGVRVRRHKHMSSIPMHEGHLLETRDDWAKHFKPRLDPDTPQRLPDDWDARMARARDDDRKEPLGAAVGSLFGWIRDWMGIENVSYCVYDDPAWFEEMVVTVADLQLACLQRLIDAGARLDALMFWEDMCYNAGPLLAPDVFNRVLVPQYRRITELAPKLGVEIVWVDCDGKIDELVPGWIEGGVNTMFPLEIGSWQADPYAFRQQYGKDLRLMGGFDKRVLAAGPEAIDAEVERLAPLVAEQGFIPFCDHRVPPDVSLADYLHYLERARTVWCR